MEKYSFFNSVEGDRRYQASDFANFWRQFLTNGVYPYPSTNLEVLANDNYTITIQSGHAMIQGYMYENTESKDLIVDVADGVLNRIDTVVVQLDLSERKIQTIIKKGLAASNPVRPSLVRTDTIYEIALADIYIGSSAASISQMQIVDLRMDTSVCGWVNSTIQVDTTAIFNQYQDWYNTKTAEYEQEFEEWFQVHKDAIGHDDHALMNSRLDALELEDVNHNSNFDSVWSDLANKNGRIETLENKVNPLIKTGTFLTPISATNTPITQRITFSKAFKTPPVISLLAVTSDPRVVELSVLSVTETYFDFVIVRTNNTVSTNIHWTAIEVTP